MAERKTPLYDSHVERGGRIVEFAGFQMPVSFEGIVAEHQRVRTMVGLFDVSHMGEIEITGDGAVGFADHVVTNNVAKLENGQICYTVACNERGKVLDDLLVYRISERRILMVVNAVNTAKIFGHLSGLDHGGVEIRDRTAEIGQIAVQGPRSKDLMLESDLCAGVRGELGGLGYYRFITFEYGGREIILSRTGYTGELGYEIYLPAESTRGVWDDLLEKGERHGAGPIGLGARDTLRFEPAFCLYGHELDEETSPLEAGLSWVVKLKKGDFIGRKALLAEKEAGPPRKLIGLEIESRGIARQGFVVRSGAGEIGRITSGTFAPTLGKSLAIASVSSETAEDGDFSVDIRGKRVPAAFTDLPFYRSRASL